MNLAMCHFLIMLINLISKCQLYPKSNHIHIGLSSNILLPHIHMVHLCLGPHLYSVVLGYHTTLRGGMVLSTALITSYCLLGAISVLGLLLPRLVFLS